MKLSCVQMGKAQIEKTRLESRQNELIKFEADLNSREKDKVSCRNCSRCER